MNTRRLTILTALALVTVVATFADDSWVIREDGAGPVKIGMSLSQLNALLNEKFVMPAEKDDRACFYVSPKKQPKLSFMMLDGRLGRIDVEKPGVQTSTGIQVGDSEKHTFQIYGHRLKAEPHHYIDNGHYLTAKSDDGRFGIRFETEDGKITRYYAGKYEAIQYIEGCE
ncbi:MAG: hypothetical protein ACHQIK_15445 [Candidatus Acidiferrales bacterium]